jgi:hypothetical protein
MAVTSAQVQELYVGLLGRAADKAGLDYWVGELNKAGTTLSLENVRANFVNEQAEYKAIYGDLSRADTVTQVYSNLFGRAPDAAGLTYWSTGAGASVNVDQLVVAFISAASTSDKQALTNKVVVSEVYSSTVGANFVKADAATIVSGVNSNATTVSTALNKLTDGSLSGVAVPVGVAQIQAQAAALKAQSDFQTSKVAELIKLNADLVAFAKPIDTDPAVPNVEKVTLLATDTAKEQFGKLMDSAGLAQEFTDARTLLGGATKTTAQLQLDAAAAAKNLTDARAELSLADAGYAAKATAYENAYKAFAAVKDVVPATAASALAVLTTATFVADSSAKTALVNALKATAITAPADLTAVAFDSEINAKSAIDAVYAVLKDSSTTAQVKAQIDSALQSFSSYSTVKALAAQAADYAAKDDAQQKAEAAFKAVAGADSAETKFVDSVKSTVELATKVEASKTLDALAAQFKAITDGNTAVNAAVTKAGTDLGSVKNLVEVTTILNAAFDADTVVATTGFTGNGGVNDLFHFGATGVAGNKDFIIDNAGSVGVKGVDSIYLGEGYVKGTATVNATDKIVGGNDGAKEVFFFQKGNDTYVIAEAKSFGSSTVANAYTAAAGDDVATIVLTGVGIEQVSFANGVVSIA